MLTPNRDYPHLSYEVITNVTQIIDTQLANGWAVRIEYTHEIEYLINSWQQWGNAHFKNIVSSKIINNILSCHERNPLCAIRLHAEKFNIRSDFYYTVCEAYSLHSNYQNHELISANKRF